MPNNIIKTFKSWPQFEKIFKSYIPKECFLSENKDKCWKWQGPKQSRGYGEIGWGNKKYLAHRISYMIFKGEVSRDQVVRHTCDNPSCVNPNHLLIGTQRDNMIDMVNRNRHRNQHENQKLNIEAVKVIKWMLKYRSEPGLASKLARLYKVHKTTISSINVGRTWSWVEV